jgi:hypothetical protein
MNRETIGCFPETKRGGFMWYVYSRKLRRLVAEFRDKELAVDFVEHFPELDCCLSYK